MGMPRDGRNPGARRAAGASEDIAISNSDGSDTSLEIPLSQLRHRPIGPGELASLRAMWWRQAGAGHRLPAEPGVIIVEGGAL